MHMSGHAQAGRRTVSRSGLALVFLGIVANEWVCARLLSTDHSLAVTSRLGIWIVDLGLIAAGATLILLRREIPWKVLAGNLLLFGLLLSLLEAVLVSALEWPILLPSGRPPGVVKVLYSWQRNIIQFSRSCARYDPRLGYTLRPGVCTFSNPEFATEYQINSRGLRDDEASLGGPEVIVLGDSYAMGWGVDQQEAFPQILEASLETPVLNAAISSYGTAREIALLGSLDRSRLKILVIQYGANDFEENESYRDAGNHLAVSSPETYRQRVENYEQERRYRFGSYLFALTKRHLIEPALFEIAKMLFTGRAPKSEEEPLPGDGRQADIFLHVLEENLKEVFPGRILVLELNAHDETDSLFTTELAAKLRTRTDNTLLSAIETVDVSGRLTADHYYRLDDHLNANGHRAVAAAILERIGQGDGR